MALGLKFWFVVAALICGAVRAENGAEGDSCVTTSGDSGVCTVLKKCASAVTALRQGTAPKSCSFKGTVPVVCCPQGRSRRSAPAGCPPLPTDAVKGSKTGQKAHDKCLELAEHVYPCEPSSKSGAPGTRERSCSQDTAPLVPGRYDAVPGEFPHMALLGFDEDKIQWSCGGTLISESWILTAAHCAYVRSLGVVKYVRLGGGDRNSTPSADDLFTVAKVITHPDYSAILAYNDIALLQLDRPVTYSKLVRPACLHTGPPRTESKATATGWGKNDLNGQLSNSLRKVIVDIFSHDECSHVFQNSRKLKGGLNETTQLCAGPKTGHADTCQGDAGGPLQVINQEVDCTYLVTGLTSFGRSCGITGQPAVFTRVSAFIPWIESVVWP